jgi:hypothetical protein
MISKLLHLLGFLKYPLYLLGGYFLVRGSLSLVQTAQSVVVLANAPGAPDIGTAFIFIGLAGSTSGLSDPNREKPTRTPRWLDFVVTVVMCLMGLLIISMFALAVVSRFLPASDNIAIGMLAFGIGLLCQARQIIQRNSLSI